MGSPRTAAPPPSTASDSFWPVLLWRDRHCGIAYPWGFYAFAVAAGLAMVALATVPADAPVPVGGR